MAEALDRIRAAQAAVKVFPLPSVVLFPGTVIPLHIFEPRYRALIRDCLGTDGVMALAQLEPGWEANYLGRPKMQPILCAGVVGWYEPAEDGQYNIILEGVARGRILEELPPRSLYREVRLEPLPDPTVEAPAEEEQVRQAVLEVCAHVPEQARDALLQLVAHCKGGELADVVAAALVPDIERRQALLSELDPRKRLSTVLQDVGAVMARLSAATRAPGPVN